MTMVMESNRIIPKRPNSTDLQHCKMIVQLNIISDCYMMMDKELNEIIPKPLNGTD